MILKMFLPVFMCLYMVVNNAPVNTKWLKGFGIAKKDYRKAVFPTFKL